jgi:hypothetical protein
MLRAGDLHFTQKEKIMFEAGYSVVRLEVGPATFRRLDLLDLARRQTDHLGPYGLRAKCHQTNRRYRRRGYLRLKFPTRRLARAYLSRVRKLRDGRIRCRLMRNPTTYRW